jgi:predicted ATPase
MRPMSGPEPVDNSQERRDPEPFLRRVRIRNYKSIESCDVSLGALTVLVGRNGAGKSNFLDALRFVADGLQTSLDHAIKARSGIDAVRRRSTGHPRNFEIGLQIGLPGWHVATYAFEIAARKEGGFVVRRERLRIVKPDGGLAASYRIEDTQLVDADSFGAMPGPPPAPDRLYLVAASGFPQFRQVYDALLSMGFYNLNPDAMKELQSPDAGELLHRDGSNIASVIARLGAAQPVIKNRIRAYLQTIVPDVDDVDRVALGPKETLEFRQRVVGSEHPWKFYAASMSDGMLRALGTLVAITQLAERTHPVSLVGIEEPETALHPAAAGALMDALREAGAHTQVVITTHSCDLLDKIDSESDRLLVVVSRQGNTQIAPADSASEQAIKEHLYLPGELLRMDQLEPDEEDLKRQPQLQLFEANEGEP